MKKMLLLFCVFANMVNAQILPVDATKDGYLVKQMLKDRQAENRVFVYSGADNNLPDSVYTYNGEEKKLYSKAAITYDEKGNKVQEKGLRDQNNDGILQDNEEFIIDYTYTQKGNLIEKETITSYLTDKGWVNDIKSVTINSTNSDYIDEVYLYSYLLGAWRLLIKEIATEFDEKERPVVVQDSSFSFGYFGDEFYSDTVAMRLNREYNENGLCDLITTFSPVNQTEMGDEWELSVKNELIYNESNKLISEVYYDYEYDEEKGEMTWNYSRTINYEYDEKGNEVSVVQSDENGVTYSIYYTNIYSSDPNANDVFFSVQSKIYPNPVSDVLYVTLEGADNAVITLVNAIGSIMVQQKTNHSVTSIPMQSFTKGFYFLTVQTNKGLKTHKVIIR